MARIGTEKRPAFLRVRTERRLKEIANICGNNGIHFVIELAFDKPEDVSDMDHALRPPEPVVADPKVGRNDPAPAVAGGSSRSAAWPHYRRAPEEGETRVRAESSAAAWSTTEVPSGTTAGTARSRAMSHLSHVGALAQRLGVPRGEALRQVREAQRLLQDAARRDGLILMLANNDAA